VTSAVPTIVVEPAVTEIPFVLSVEPVAVVFIIHAIVIVAAPCGIIIVAITRIIPFCDAEATFYTNL
jgi:hypothetical protein